MYCESPNIILRKDLSKYLKNYLSPKLIYNDGTTCYTFNYKKNGFPSPKKYNITYENYKNWSLQLVDGELVDVYQPVSCGHCILCRDKRAKEWATRATCETAAAEYPPLFLTLTYEQKYLPKDGVEKEALQKFLKRFRINWHRKFHYTLNLRYFGVGEYGRTYGRPHYHLLFWNIPNDGNSSNPLSLVHLKTVEELVQRSWSEIVSFEEYKTLKYYQKYHEKRKKYNKEVVVHYRKIGKIEVTPDRGNSAGYAMKYMRKEAINPLKYKNQPFYLSSRRNGAIGFPFIKKQINSIRTTPQATKIQVPTSLGKVGNYSLPRSFKDKLFPNFSQLVNPHISQQVERFITLVKVLQENSDRYKVQVSAAVASIRQKLGPFYEKIRKDMIIYKKAKLFPIDVKKLSNYYYQDYLVDNLRHIYQQLCNYDWPNMQYYYNLKEKRQHLLSLQHFQEVDVQAAIYSVNRKLRLNSIRETF